MPIKQSIIERMELNAEDVKHRTGKAYPFFFTDLRKSPKNQ